MVTETVYRDTTLYLPGATVRETVYQPGDTLFCERTVVDSTGRAQLRWWRDYAGHIQAECTAKDTALTIQKVFQDRIVNKTMQVPVVVKVVPVWVWVVFCLIALLILGWLLLPTILRLIRPL